MWKLETGWMYRRRKRKPPFAAYAALAFNVAICLAPFVATQAMRNAYGGEMVSQTDSDASIYATRRAMNVRFNRLASRDGQVGRDAWAQLIRDELDAGDMAAVRGFLQAAPAMLDEEDAASLNARIAVSDGGGEDVLIEAALAYLPEDIQIAYERQSTSRFAQLDLASAASLDAADEENATSDGFEAFPESYDDEGGAQFSVLGDLRDLSLMAARWTRNDRIDEFAFALSGVGLILADADARHGASIIMSGRRAQSLDPAFSQYLQRKLFSATPPQRLKRRLSSEFQHEFGYVTDGPAILEDVFKSSVDETSLGSLLLDMRIINDIANETSPAAAVTILSQVKNSSDLRRARLVSRAGGDRAVALALYDGDRLLDTARTVIVWTPTLIAQVFALLLCVGILAGIALNVAWKSFRRTAPVRRSAVYGLEELAP